MKRRKTRRNLLSLRRRLRSLSLDVFFCPSHFLLSVPLALFMIKRTDEWIEIYYSLFVFFFLFFFFFFLFLLICWRFTACSRWHARRLVLLIGQRSNQFQRINFPSAWEKNGGPREREREKKTQRTTDGKQSSCLVPPKKRFYSRSFSLTKRHLTTVTNQGESR